MDIFAIYDFVNYFGKVSTRLAMHIHLATHTSHTRPYTHVTNTHVHTRTRLIIYSHAVTHTHTHIYSPHVGSHRNTHTKNQTFTYELCTFFIKQNKYSPKTNIVKIQFHAVVHCRHTQW